MSRTAREASLANDDDGEDNVGMLDHGQLVGRVPLRQARSVFDQLRNYDLDKLKQRTWFGRFSDNNVETQLIAFTGERSKYLSMTAVLLACAVLIAVSVFVADHTDDMTLTAVELTTSAICFILALADVLLCSMNALGLDQTTVSRLHEYISTAGFMLVLNCVYLTSELVLQRCTTRAKDQPNDSARDVLLRSCTSSFYPFGLLVYDTIVLLLRARARLTIPILMSSVVFHGLGRLLVEHRDENESQFWLRWTFNAAMALQFCIVAFVLDYVQRSRFIFFMRARVFAVKTLEVRDRLDSTLRSLLPVEAVIAMLEGRQVIDRSDAATVSVCEIFDYVRWSMLMVPKHVVEVVSVLESLFDSEVQRCGLRKMKMTGDRYSVVTPLNADTSQPTTIDSRTSIAMFANPNGHQTTEIKGSPQALARFAFFQQVAASAVNGRIGADQQLQLHTAIHTGPCFGAVVGYQSVSYEYFGEAVTVASSLLSAIPARETAVTAVTLDQHDSLLEVVEPVEGTGTNIVFQLRRKDMEALVVKQRTGPLSRRPSNRSMIQPMGTTISTSSSAQQAPLAGADVSGGQELLSLMSSYDGHGPPMNLQPSHSRSHSASPSVDHRGAGDSTTSAMTPPSALVFPQHTVSASAFQADTMLSPSGSLGAPQPRAIHLHSASASFMVGRKFSFQSPGTSASVMAASRNVIGLPPTGALRNFADIAAILSRSNSPAPPAIEAEPSGVLDFAEMSPRDNGFQSLTNIEVIMEETGAMIDARELRRALIREKVKDEMVKPLPPGLQALNDAVIEHLIQEQQHEVAELEESFRNRRQSERNASTPPPSGAAASSRLVTEIINNSDEGRMNNTSSGSGTNPGIAGSGPERSTSGGKSSASASKSKAHVDPALVSRTVGEWLNEVEDDGLVFSRPIVEKAYLDYAYRHHSRTTSWMSAHLAVGLSFVLLLTLIEKGAIDTGAMYSSVLDQQTQDCISKLKEAGTPAPNATNAPVDPNACPDYNVIARQYDLKVPAVICAGVVAIFSFVRAMYTRRRWLKTPVAESLLFVASVAATIVSIGTMGVVTANRSLMCIPACFGPLIMFVDLRMRYHTLFILLLLGTTVPYLIVFGVVNGTFIPTELITYAPALACFAYAVKRREAEERRSFVDTSVAELELRSASDDLRTQRALMTLLFPPLLVNPAVTMCTAPRDLNGMSKAPFLRVFSRTVVVMARVESVLSSGAQLGRAPHEMMAAIDRVHSGVEGALEGCTMLHLVGGFGDTLTFLGPLSAGNEDADALDDDESLLILHQQESGEQRPPPPPEQNVQSPLQQPTSPSVADPVAAWGSSATPSFAEGGDHTWRLVDVEENLQSGLDEAIQLMQALRLRLGSTIAAVSVLDSVLVTIQGRTAPTLQASGVAIRQSRALLEAAADGFVGLHDNFIRGFAERREGQKIPAGLGQPESWAVMGVGRTQMYPLSKGDGDSSAKTSPANSGGREPVIEATLGP